MVRQHKAAHGASQSQHSRYREHRSYRAADAARRQSREDQTAEGIEQGTIGREEFAEFVNTAYALYEAY